MSRFFNKRVIRSVVNLWTANEESAIEDEDKVIIEEDEAVVKLIESNWSDWHSTTDDELFKDILLIINKCKNQITCYYYKRSNCILSLYIDSLLFVLSRPNGYSV